MFFVNLSMGEFFTLLGVVSGLVTALYLLDKSKRKKVVSTLRFWAPARSAEELQSRRRMRDPWSLLLQLLGLLLLLLAIAQLQWGSKRWRGRDHVLLLDTSAWSAGKTAGGTVLDEEKRLALSYLAVLPANDRVMLVRVDSLTTPITAFTDNRGQLREEVASSRSEYSALNIEEALSFSAQARKGAEGSAGEIVYVGPRMISNQTADSAPPGLRLLNVDLNRQHVGIQHLAAKRDQDESTAWEATVTLRNFGNQPRSVRLETRYAGTQFAPRLIQIAPHQETAAEYRFVSPAAGELVSRIVPADDLPTDQEARLGLPRSAPLQVTVYTSRPAEWRPLLEANHRLIARFVNPVDYSPAQLGDVVILDTFIPRTRPSLPSLWIHPPRDRSPIAVKGTDYDSVIKNWHNETILGAGLRAKEMHIANAEIFDAIEGDIPVANAAGGPVVLAREGTGSDPRFGIIGFDPLQEQLKFATTTPILFANFLRWLSPESFRAIDVSAGSVGTAAVSLDPNERADQLRVVDGKGLASPFTVRAGMLQLFAAEPSVLHVYSGDRERIISLTLPEVAESEWKIPATAAQGLPRQRSLAGVPVDLWKWLATAGLVFLLAEWYLFGRQRRAVRPAASGRKTADQSQPEMVAK